MWLQYDGKLNDFSIAKFHLSAFLEEYVENKSTSDDYMEKCLLSCTSGLGRSCMHFYVQSISYFYMRV